MAASDRDGRRNHAEPAIGRCRHLIGAKLRTRSLPGQQGEVAIAASRLRRIGVLNRMIRTAKPIAVRITGPPQD